MKKIKFLLFASLSFCMVLFVSADATAQAKKDVSKMQKQSVKTVELKQDVSAHVTPTLKSNEQMQAQQPVVNTEEKQTKVTKINENLSAKAKVKRGIVPVGTLKLKSAIPK